MEQKLTPKSIYENLKDIEVPEGTEVLHFLSNGEGHYFDVLRRHVISQIHSDEHLGSMLAEATNTTPNYDLVSYYLSSNDVFSKAEGIPMIDGKGNFTLVDNKVVLRDLEHFKDTSVLEQMLAGDTKRWDYMADFVAKYYDPTFPLKKDQRNEPKARTEEDVRREECEMAMQKSMERCRSILSHNSQCESQIKDLEAQLQQIEQQMNGLVPVTRNPIKKIWQEFKNRKVKRELEIDKTKKRDEIDTVEASKYSEEDIRKKLLEEVQVQKDVAVTDYMKRIVEKRECYTENCSISDLTRLYHNRRDFDTTEIFMSEARDLVKDVRSHILIMQKMYSPDLIQEESLEGSCRKIREMLFDSDIVFDDGRKKDVEYRSRTDMKPTNFIKGAKLSKDEITGKMKELEAEYSEAMQCEGTEEYIRRCADLHMKFAMLHPYEDGNGRTARVLLNVMLAKRDIVMPSLYNTYMVDRGQNGVYTKAGNEAAKAEPNFQYFQDYLIERVQMFNPDVAAEIPPDHITYKNQDNNEQNR